METFCVLIFAQRYQYKIVTKGKFWMREQGISAALVTCKGDTATKSGYEKCGVEGGDTREGARCIITPI